MSDFSTLLVLFVDEAAKARWSGPIREAARSAGLTVLEQPAGATYEPDADAAILTDDINWTLLVAPQTTAFFSEAAFPVPSCDRPGMVERSLIFEHSRRLIVAAKHLDYGAVVFGPDDLQANLPLLGRVHADRGAPSGGPRHASPLDMYLTIPPTVGASAVWGGGLFAYPERDQLDGGSPLVDLTGRSRAVVHGPYYYLSPGVWRSVTHLVVDPEGSEARLRMEWGTGPDMTTQTSVFAKAGRYRLEMEHTWRDAGAAQLVVWVDKPLFQGRLEIETCAVELIAPYSAPSRGEE